MIIEKLILNESLKEFLGESAHNLQEFFVSDLASLRLRDFPIFDLTNSLAVMLKNNDVVASARYGIEIKVGGVSRFSRIPLLRASNSHMSIWKIVKGLKNVDKGVNELEIFLDYVNTDLPTFDLPIYKILVVVEDENKYSHHSNKDLNDYAKNIVNKHNVIWISLEYLFSILSDSCDFDQILSSDAHMLTINKI